jgi:hypothetical protein
MILTWNWVRSEKFPKKSKLHRMIRFVSYRQGVWIIPYESDPGRIVSANDTNKIVKYHKKRYDTKIAKPYDTIMPISGDDYNIVKIELSQIFKGPKIASYAVRIIEIFFWTLCSLLTRRLDFSQLFAAHHLIAFYDA